MFANKNSTSEEETIGPVTDIVDRSSVVKKHLVTSERLLESTTISLSLPYDVSKGQTMSQTMTLIDVNNELLHNSTLNLTIYGNSDQVLYNSPDKVMAKDSFFNELKTLLRGHPMALMTAVTYVI